MSFGEKELILNIGNMINIFLVIMFKCKYQHHYEIVDDAGINDYYK